jgi:hypothetical protein
VTVQAPPESTRRDRRYNLRQGAAFVEFADPRTTGRRVSAALKLISAAGLCFETEPWGRELLPGSILLDTTLRVGDCVLRGEIILRNVHDGEKRSVILGGIFCPASPEIEDRLMTLIAGIEAAAPLPPEVDG